MYLFLSLCIIVFAVFINFCHISLYRIQCSASNLPEKSGHCYLLPKVFWKSCGTMAFLFLSLSHSLVPVLLSRLQAINLLLEQYVSRTISFHLPVCCFFSVTVQPFKVRREFNWPNSQTQINTIFLVEFYIFFFLVGFELNSTFL